MTARITVRLAPGEHRAVVAALRAVLETATGKGQRTSLEAALIRLLEAKLAASVGA